MDRQELLRSLESLRRASGRGGATGVKAPHQPLLLLELLHQLNDADGHGNRFPFSEVRDRFERELWPRFGWSTRTRAALPFWHLAAGPLWQLIGTAGPISVKGTKPPSEERLAASVAYGAFPDDVWAALRDPSVRREAMELLVTRYFPKSAQPELRAAMGLPDPEEAPSATPRAESVEGRRRSAADQARFREIVLRAYEGSCAICGFRPHNARAPSAIQAAHVWPVEYDGPYVIENGLALCPMHHWALDSGTIAISDDHLVLVSSRVFDGPVFEAALRAYSRKPLRGPQRGNPAPSTEFTRLQRQHRFLGDALP